MMPRPAYLRSNARSGGLSLVRRSSLQQGRNYQQIVDKHGGADKQLEALPAFGKAALHSAAAKQD
jgi:hypothetical protein